MLGQEIFTRNGNVLNRKFRKYLVPTIAMSFAISLNEFVDSILVANLLDLKAMTIISVASPILWIIAAAYMLFGIGGSMMYALNIGQRNKKEAGKYFVVAFGAALAFAIAMCALGIIFLNPICDFLCVEPTMISDLTAYVRIIFFSAPVIIGVQTFSSFLSAAGVPSVAMVVCVVANVFNLIFDYFYVKVLHMGVEATALATLSGYVVCLIVLIFILLWKKTHIYKSMPSLKDIKKLRDIVSQGGANSVGQIGYMARYMFFNYISMSLGGIVALETMTVCMQLFSIVSIGVAGVADAVSPFVSVLRGQRDVAGIKYVIRLGVIYVAVMSNVLVILFEIYPQLLFYMFNVTNPSVIEMAAYAIRIFSLMFLVRSIIILYNFYIKVLGFTVYSVIVSLLDAGALLIPIAILCTGLWGVTGIWISFPVASLLIFIGMLIYSKYIVKKSGGKRYGLFLLESEENSKIYDITIGEQDETIAQMSESVIDFCTDNGIAVNLAKRIGLICEEMAVYTRFHRKNGEQIDIMIRIEDSQATVDFRSEGTPFNPLSKSDKDDDMNLNIINKIPSSIDYDYVLGMNSTRFTMK